MPKYKYKTVDAEGKPHNGEATAKSEQAVVAEIRRNGLTLIEIIEVVEKKDTAKSAVASTIIFNFGISLKQLSLFTRQLATTLTAGIPLLRIIAVLRKRNSSPVMCQLLDALSADLQKGLRFSEALSKHPKCFNETFINMTKVGEASGNLPETMTRLALMMEKEVAVRRKISGASAYPMFILIFTCALSYALVAFLLPMFIPMLESSGLNVKRDYPLTAFLMAASDFATNKTNLFLIAISACLLVVAYKAAQKTKTGRYVTDLCKFYFPFIHGVMQEGSTARFARSFSLLLQSGVPLLQALNLVSGAAGNTVISRALDGVAKDITEGGRLSEKLDKTGVFPDLMIQMCSIGEEAGSLPEMFDHVADYYEAEIDSTIGTLTSVLEPAMMILVGLLVGVFIMGVLLPIMGDRKSVV